MTEFTREHAGRYAVTRSPESRAPIACEPLPPQPVTPSLRLAADLLNGERAPRLEQELIEQLRAELDADVKTSSIELPSWDRRDVGRWRQERAALEAASAALEPAPITARGVLRGIVRAAIAVPMIIIAEARRG